MCASPHRCRSRAQLYMMTPITKPDDLLLAAYHSERVLSRRLAKRTGLSEHQALTKILEEAAGTLPLADLIALRAGTKQHALAKAAARRSDKANAAAKKSAEMQPDPIAWLAWFDGATRPNPGKMGIGGLLRSPDAQTIEISHAAGHGDSNEAEYLALIAVLEAAVCHQPEQLMVYGDSRVVIDDMNTSGAHCFAAHRTRAKQLVSQLKTVTLRWVPRRKNAAADALSQRAIDLVVCPSI